MTTDPMQYAAAAVPPVPDGGGISAGLQITLGRVASAQERVAAALNDLALKRADLPVTIPLVKTGLIPNPTVPTLIRLGSPQNGRRWVVRRWGVAASDDVTSYSGPGFANLYVGRPFGLNLTTGSVEQWSAFMGSLPGIEYFSNDQIVVLPGQELYLIVSQVTAGIQIASACNIMDMPQASYASTTDV